MSASPRTLCGPNDSPSRFKGCAREAAAKYLRPGREKPAVGRLQRHDPDAGRAQHIDPIARGAELRPAGAAERQDGGVGLGGHAAVRRRERERPRIVPAGPSMPQLEGDARRIEAPQPGAQQRRGLHGFRKHPAARADERFLPQRLAPGAQRRRRKRLDRRPQPSLGGAVAAEQPRQVLAVREVQPAAPRQQKLAPERRHPVVHRDARAAADEHLRRHQPGRTAADDGDVGLGASWHDRPV